MSGEKEEKLKFAFVIPVYMHGATVDATIKKIAHFNFPVILIDDGNPPSQSRYISEAKSRYDLVTVVTHEVNMGKGAAMTSGIKAARGMGVTHVLQLDADGQHDTSYCQSFFALSCAHPDAIIAGYPEYDETVPPSRASGRKIANFWMHLNSLDFSVKDSMCGFRVYPVKSYLAIENRYHLNKRMCVDCEVIVYAIWQGVPVVNAPVKVTYPKEGVSNYKLFWDNFWMTLMFMRTFFGMIVRAPLLLWRRARNGGSNALGG